ncbi:ferredoxin [Amycolatopsis sp. NPDC005232]|uniref:ferredoxin n=1 Tax=Amycolatopsis sp. NPDC005232 TaxID=3157027 RepID=UPI0033B6DB61
MRVSIQRERCVTSGRCVVTAPEVFGHNDDGIVTLLDEAPAPDRHAAVREAAYLCPSLAIELHGGQR